MWRQTTALACLTTSPLTDARRELEDERLCALEDRLDAALQLGLHGDVLSEVRALTCEHPERERLWATLMLALYRSGRQAESLDTYLVARTELDAAFGIEPGLVLRELQRRILEQDAALDPPDASSAPVSVPFPPSSFVGRIKELEDAIELLSDGNVRLVTVIGPGGIGKSRFAIESLGGARNGFRTGSHGSVSMHSTIRRACCRRSRRPSEPARPPIRWTPSIASSARRGCCSCSTASSTSSTPLRTSITCWRGWRCYGSWSRAESGSA